MRDRIKKNDHNQRWDWLPEIIQFVIEQATTLQQIPAPTFAEANRAAYVQNQFAAFNLSDIRTDDLFNVYGRLPGTNGDTPALMITAHTDTVFPAQTDLSLSQEGQIIYGPGLGDNCFGVAGLLAVIATFHNQKITPARDIWFVATTREEGLGNLDGMKVAYKALADKVNAVINLEGLAFGHVYHGGIAVRRLHITAAAAGGHSWLHFGRPSAVHSIIQLGHNIVNLQPPRTPRTTFNIGIIEGGQGINVIATSAGFWLDMRSEQLAALTQFETQVRDEVARLNTSDVQFQVEIVGERPAGKLSPQHELVTGALAALAQVGIQGTLETGSTDANIPLAAGCPAITIGITRGGNAHRLDEYVELGPVEAGIKQLLLLTMTLTDNP